MVFLRSTLKKPLTIWLALGLITLSAAPGCLGPIRGTVALRDAQDLFNQASSETLEQHRQTVRQLDVQDLPPPSQPEKYQKVVEIIEGEVLDNVDRNDLKINAYALAAFAHWRLGNFTEAKNLAVAGQDLYERSGLTTNRRDYGMLIICPGLVDHSIAYQDYQRRRAQAEFLSISDATDIDTAMNRALAKIDTVNSKMAPDEPVVIYANQQQLLIIRNILNVWGDVHNPDDRKAPICKWTARGDALRKNKFPQAEFAGRVHVDDLHTKIMELREVFQPCP